MASILKVDKLDPQSGTALEIGTSGDTITVPSGATFAVSGTMNASSITAGTLAIAQGGTGAATLAAAGLSNAPAFEAYLSSTQDIGDSVNTRVEINTELVDTDGCYDNSTNYRFTPTTAGKYFAYFTVIGFTSGAGYDDILYIAPEIKKNGTRYVHSLQDIDNSAGERQQSVTTQAIIDMNGSSDYLDYFCEINAASGTGTLRGDESKTRAGAFLLIGV